MEQLEMIKNTLMSQICGQMANLNCVDAKELGEVVDMVKDLEEAKYYCTITKAMKEKYEDGAQHYYTPYYYPERDVDRPKGRMYYSSNYDFMGDAARYSDHTPKTTMRDPKEGRSSIKRKYYIESKEKNMNKETQMKELEDYMKELSYDITEMIEKMSPEEKSMLHSKMMTLVEKI